MNKLVLTYLLLVSGIGLLFGQPQETSIDPTTAFLPPSPQAAALTKYIDFPVNNHTGTPQISLPVHTLNGQGISVPVSLSYHAGGVRVDEMEGNAGIGWSIQAGGVINRTVRGGADERPNGLHKHSTRN